MYTRLLWVSCLLPLLYALPVAAANNPISISVGAGINYTGYGAAVGYSWEHSSISVSAGLMTSSRIYGEHFGGGISYQRNDLLSQYFDNPEKHAFGLYAGTVGTRFDNFGLGGYRYEPLYGAALTYNYFFNGFHDRGFHVGAFLGYGANSDANATPAGLQLGYRF